jgi:hypothetical protein
MERPRKAVHAKLGAALRRKKGAREGLSANVRLEIRRLRFARAAPTLSESRFAAGRRARARGQPLLCGTTRALTARGRLRRKTQIPHRQLRLFPPVCTLRSSLFRLSALKWHLQRREKYYKLRDFWRRSCSRGAHVIALAPGFVLRGVGTVEKLLSLSF